MRTSRPTSPSATCSPPRSPARTATPWRRTTTWCHALRWCSSTTATPGPSSAARRLTTSSCATGSSLRETEVMDERVRVGILGCGHVGGALVRLILDHADVIEARAGVPLEVARVAVAHLDKERDL